MEKKKKISLSAYSLLSISSGMTLAATALSILLPIIFTLTKTEMPGWFGLTVRLEPIAESKLVVANGDFLLTGIQGTITAPHLSTVLMILNNLIPIMVLGSWAYGIYLIRKIIKNVYEGKHFMSVNVKYMRTVAFLIIIIPHIHALLQNIIVSSLPKDLVVEGMKVSRILAGPVNVFSFSLIPEYVLVGLIVFVFSEVFKQGNILKEENDLTV